MYDNPPDDPNGGAPGNFPSFAAIFGSPGPKSLPRLDISPVCGIFRITGFLIFDKGGSDGHGVSSIDIRGEDTYTLTLPGNDATDAEKLAKKLIEQQDVNCIQFDQQGKEVDPKKVTGFIPIHTQMVGILHAFPNLSQPQAETT